MVIGFVVATGVTLVFAAFAVAGYWIARWVVGP